MRLWKQNNQDDLFDKGKKSQYTKQLRHERILYGWELIQLPFVSGIEVWVLRNRNLRTGSGQECSSHKKNLLCAARVPGGVNCKGNVYKFPYIQDFPVCMGTLREDVHCARKENCCFATRARHGILLAKFHFTYRIFLYVWEHFVRRIYEMHNLSACL